MIIEIDYTAISGEDEENNVIGKLLCLPEWFSSMTIEVEAQATRGYAGTYWQPEEYPEMNVENLVVTRIHNEYGRGIKITPKQSLLIEHLLDDKTVENYCWDCLACAQEDVGDY